MLRAVSFRKKTKISLVFFISTGIVLLGALYSTFKGFYSYVVFAIILSGNPFIFQYYFVLLPSKTLPRLVAGVSLTQEESPGSAGRPTSESGSCW